MNKIVIAITGASGSIYAKLLVEKLLQARNQVDEIGLVMSDNAKSVWQYELGNSDYLDFSSRKTDGPALKTYGIQDFFAPFASGSGQFTTMIIVPCSMGTMGRIANGVSGDLVTRAADVILKERRKLILAIRDMPYNLVHIRNMETITLAGGIICPATPSYYSMPKTVEQVAATVVDRLIDLAGIQQSTYRWGGAE